MQFLTQYITAIKNLNKKYYFTPLLILIYVFLVYQIWSSWTKMTGFGFDGVDVVRFFVTLIMAYKLTIVQILFYPHANYFIQTTWLYEKVFGSAWGGVKSGLSKYLNIGKDIPDDYRVRSSSGSVYTVSASYKTKRDRVSDLRIMYVLYLIGKFFFKDLLLRVFTHFGVFIISPLLFLIAIPLLKKKGLLINIEK